MWKKLSLEELWYLLRKKWSDGKKASISVSATVNTATFCFIISHKLSKVFLIGSNSDK